MDVRKAVRKRRSVRAYSDKEIPDDVLEDVLEAARLAPSAGNGQHWKLIVVRDNELRQKLVRAGGNQQFIGEAPVVIAGIALKPDDVMTCDVPAYAVDLAIALDHITLVAAEKGLGTCWIGAYTQEKVKEILEIPDKYKVVSIMPLGYPADSPRPKNRKDFNEVVCFDKFKE